ncbi:MULTISPECIES: hypothetical protein [unclassified Streptomyces]|uniref:hypothetical protein n=1 Tax=unclassified Streptomyces TaxID=2593676 RepID=UPI00278C2F9D|nr:MULTISPECIES: hypothetical protein [unclassified Streptomyces]
MTENFSPSPPAEPNGVESRGADRASVLFADTLRGGAAPLNVDRERRALDAYRAARDSGALAAATPRRRDDWRPRRQRPRWSVRAGAGALFASVAVGGVAVAGIGSGVLTVDDGDRPGAGPGRGSASPSPAVTAPDLPGAGTPGATTLPDPDPEPRAEDGKEGRGGEGARCVSYEDGRGLSRAERAAEGCDTPSPQASRTSRTSRTGKVAGGGGSDNHSAKSPHPHGNK